MKATWAFIIVVKRANPPSNRETAITIAMTITASNLIHQSISDANR